MYLALDNNLEILPVINKIDLPSADPERVRSEIEDVIGLDASEAVLASAKAGIGIEEILEQVVKTIPAPAGDPDAPLKALIFDSLYDPYRGVVAYIRVAEGTVKVGDKVRMMATGKEFEVNEVGVFTPKAVLCDDVRRADDERHHHLTPLGVGRTHHAGFGDGGVRHQHLFDLAG